MMPEKLTFGPTHRQLTVGGAPAHEFEGVLQDPAGSGTQLKALFDLVQPPGGGSVLLAQFASPAEFENQRPVFAKVRDGLRLTG
jgi:hypothetical protein